MLALRQATEEILAGDGAWVGSHPSQEREGWGTHFGGGWRRCRSRRFGREHNFRNGSGAGKFHGRGGDVGVFESGAGVEEDDAVCRLQEAGGEQMVIRCSRGCAFG